MSSKLSLTGQIPIDSFGLRLDQVVAEMFPEYSRSKIQEWIKTGALRIDGDISKPKTKVFGGEAVSIDVESEPQGEWQAEAMDLDIIHEDDQILVVNKPIDLVVHPAAGNWSGTLLNGLLHHCPSLVELPRAGIVHRLDKDTSGLMVVAKTLIAQTSLVDQLQERSVSRIYRAVVHGELRGKGVVEADIGRHPKARTKMAVVTSNGKFARTHYRKVQLFEGFSYIELKLDSGRTHQIRVHMAHLGFPLVGDSVYGRKIAPALTKQSDILDTIERFNRQALHAKSLGLIHPKTNEYCAWTIPIAQDMEELLSDMRDAL